MAKKNATKQDNKNSCFVVTRRILVTSFQSRKIDKEMDAANRLYNMGVSHYRDIVNTMMHEPDFLYLLKKYHQWWNNHPDAERGNPYQSEISLWISSLELNEYDLQRWFGETAKKSFSKCINSAIVQKLATNLFSSIKKVIFLSGRSIHYRKYGETNSLEGKANTTGIIYDEDTDKVTFSKMEMTLKPVRESDHYLQEAMRDGKVKYCRIVRKSFKNGYRYFLQIVMGGSAPKKFTVKEGVTGQDPGISNSSFVGENYCGFETLAYGCEKYEKLVKQAAIKYERRRRMANPQNYNEDGTIKRGVKLVWKRTKGILKALFELKDAYRKKSEHVKNYNGWLSNQVVRGTSVLRQEQMDYRALAQRAKGPAERSEKESVVKNKKGEEKKIHKFKRKRRYGRSILRRAPGAFDKMVRDKVIRYGGKVELLDPRITASSQVDHTTGKRTKIPLSQRTKIIDGKTVQRDLYASYLNEFTNKDHVLDIEKCKENFERFLKQQEEVVAKIRKIGDKTGNFGLADFA